MRLPRWLKILLRIDPLVGMYFVNYVNGGYTPNWGIVLGRIETGAAPKYLLRYFLDDPCDDALIVDLWPENAGPWCTFHDTREEAEKWLASRSDCALRMRLAANTAAPASWEPPQPERPN
jgi:hypothetical protein